MPALRLPDSRCGRLAWLLAAIVAIVLAVLIVCLEPAQAAPARKQSAPRLDYLELAAILIRDGHMDRAAAILSRVQPTQPGLDRKRYHTLVGIVAARRGDHRAAATHLEAAIRLGEKNPRLQLQLAQSRFHLKDHRGAMAALDLAGEAAAAAWGAWLIRAQSHLALGAEGPAFQALYAGRLRHPQAVGLQRQLVLLLVKRKLYVQALAEGRRLLGYARATLEDSLAIAEALRRARQPGRGALLLEEARLRSPWNRQLLLQLARCHLDDGKPLAAATLLHRASYLDPRLRVEAAELYRRALRPTLALLLNQQVVDQGKKFRQRLGLLVEAGRFEEAAALAPRLSRLGLLKDQDIRYALAYALFRAGKHREAEAWLQRISRADLFHKVVELRRILGACRQAGWQCPE